MHEIAKSDDAPLRICLLSYRSNAHCGGQGVYVRNLSRALKALGHHVEVVSGPPVLAPDNGMRIHPLQGLDLYNPDNLFRFPELRELADPINLIEWLGVSSMGFPEPFTFGLRALKFLKKRFGRYDIVHDNQSLSYGVRHVGRFAPIIATIHHPITVDRRLAVRNAPTFWRKLKELRWYSFIGMQKKVARSFSHIITVSRCSAKDISREFRIPPERFRIVPNGVDTGCFHPLGAVEREKDRVLVTNSADTPLKGLSYLIKSVGALARVRPVKLVVVGAARKNGDIARLIADLGIGKMVTFTGRIDHQDLVTQYAKAAVAVVPSLYEGFGLPAIEAMACAVPVVATTGGALPEIVGPAGRLVPPKDELALAAVIRRLLDNPGLAAELGQAGYRRVQERYTWKKAAEQTVQAYREAVGAFDRSGQARN